MLVDKKHIHASKDVRIDEGAIIGYKTHRKIKGFDLYIGKGSLIMSGAVIYAGAKIGQNATIGHNSIVREENLIGDNFSLWNSSVLDYGCRVGSNVKIHCNVYIAQFTDIEDDVFIAPGAMIANDLHPKCKFSKKCMRGPRIKKGTIIGINVTINPFVTIGERAFIGSGSVVTRDIPPGKIAYGNPARIAGDISKIRCVKGLIDFPYR